VYQLAERGGGARGACSILIIVFYIQSGMILSVFENGRGGGGPKYLEKQQDKEMERIKKERMWRMKKINVEFG